jgi:hypothetical protein
MFKREITRKGQVLIINRLGGNKILLSISINNGVVLRNVVLDRLESKFVSRELGCIPSKWDEVSKPSEFINGSRLLSNLK